MILYRLAKWMEERKRLKRLIDEAEGDSAMFLSQKQNVERRMFEEAYQWLEPGRAGMTLRHPGYASEHRAANGSFAPEEPSIAMQAIGEAGVAGGEGQMQPQA